MSTSTLQAPTRAYPFAAAAKMFGVADHVIGRAGRWFAQKGVPDEAARQLLIEDLLGNWLPGTSAYRNEVRGFVGRSADEANAKLAAAGLDIRLKPFSNPQSFGAVGVSRVGVSWKKAGRRTLLSLNDPSAPHGYRDFPAFRLGKGAGATLYSLPGDRQVVDIRTAEGYMMRLTETDDPGDQASELSWVAQLLHRRTMNPRHHVPCASFTIPMVKLNQRPDASALIGANTGPTKGDWDLVQVVLQSIFAMDENGALSNEGAAAEARPRGGFGGGYDYRIERPFLVTIGRESAPVPAFSAFVGLDSWADPRGRV